MGGNGLFFWPQHCWEGGEEEVGRLRDEPKAEKKKLSLGAGSNVTITWKSFFTQSQVLLSSGIVVTPSYTLGRIRLCIRNKS